ncbi:isochorismatase-like protein [Gottschalkia purinilytica]|uniref:Isochorismatase-like protein n=1 Tax=Gottschalkia purinilytica TaxID=1503 RepID=A0A0L0WE25_GOTPU|nr:isochorismatase family cysteine hydrolase [Gottschalkia purinilytica]KNF09670.1 isochorismatase-like protein [Gottschalkia purinilytica]
MPINNLGKIKKEDCAVIIIDMQYDFIAEGAPIECPGGREVISNIQKLKKWAKKNDIPVMYTQEVHRKQKVDFGLELERSEPEHCLYGTCGVEIIDELKPDDDDYVILKRRYSGFYLTDLEILMRGLKKNALIITGAATNVCVYATALDAQQRDMNAIVVSDCVAGTDVELHKAFLKNIDYVIGDVVDVDSLIETFDNNK